MAHKKHDLRAGFSVSVNDGKITVKGAYDRAKLKTLFNAEFIGYNHFQGDLKPLMK